MQIERIDHLVLTVADVGATARFYAEVLGMSVVETGGRTALRFGEQKINLHPWGHEFEPKAAKPTPGAADICLLTTIPVTQVIDELVAKGIAIVEGPIQRTGAVHPLRSVYIRDPDGNLIEIANEIAEG
jgi:catechol 2,3-dioxygenase-like lactoylglutathione lyase family enzyme